MQKNRVLIADDSAVMRRILRDAFSSDPMIEVVGAAANGRAAVSLVEQIHPDALTLDVEMPEMDGFEALSQIRASHPELPVIMFSSLTARGAQATIRALALGATDYVTKPSDVGDFSRAVEQIRNQLIPKVRAFCAPKGGQGLTSSPQIKAVGLAAATDFRSSRIDVVAIGTSTGGPNALAAVLPQIPAEFPVPVLIVQHMPPLFTKFLADRLNSCSQIPVKEAAMGEELLPGRAWVAAGDYHMTVTRRGTHVMVETDQKPAENSCRPSVDVLFRSVANVYGASALAVVMTGMGQDGLIGCEHVHKAGGRIIVQDEHSSVVWGMPGFVAKAGLADRVLPLDVIGANIVQRTLASRAPTRAAACQ